MNLAARQLQQWGLAAHVERVLQETGLDPAWLDLELTESVLIENAVQAVETLKDLRALGVRLSVDDFGTGYSSLSYLRSFPFDALKIDRSFVRDLTNEAGDVTDQAVIRAVVDLAHALDLEVVAEGVETDGQRDCLRALGCDVFQGYLFSPPPVALAELDALLPPARGALAGAGAAAVSLARAA